MEVKEKRTQAIHQVHLKVHTLGLVLPANVKYTNQYIIFMLKIMPIWHTDRRKEKIMEYLKEVG